jgi:hypothetical protein
VLRRDPDRPAALRDLGFIEYSGGDSKVNSSLLTIVLHD